jgi:hypothetical protein
VTAWKLMLRTTGPRHHLSWRAFHGQRWGPAPCALTASQGAPALAALPQFFAKNTSKGRTVSVHLDVVDLNRAICRKQPGSRISAYLNSS